MRPIRAPWLLGLLFLCVFAPTPAHAEGSRELNANGGDRPHLLYRPNRDVSGIPSAVSFGVYVEAGETLRLGSSAAGIGNGTINYVAPDGSTGTCGANGFIANRTEELAGPVGSGAGGFDPCIVPVGAGQAGIWEVTFVSPDPDAGGSGAPREPVGSTWSPQQNGDFFVSAWDITVENASGTFVNGRTFANYLPLRVSTSDIFKRLNSTVFVLTEDGYQYQVGFNNIQPEGFIFFANNKGFTQGGDPIFGSLQFEGGDLGTIPSGFNFQRPDANDTATDITHKLFFNIPDSATETASPVTIPTPDGTGTWWLRTATPPPDPTGFRFVGEEGTVGQAGTSPLQGAFEFTNPGSKNVSYTIGLDVDRDGAITAGGQDVILVGTATPGSNSVSWDGKDGQGNDVSAGNTTYQATITFAGGEVHFPLLDVENNANGIIVTRCDEGNRASCNPATIDPFAVFFDDTRLSGGSKNLAGVDSSGGAHSWSNNFGDAAGIDTWAYAPRPLPLQDILVIKEAELSIEKTVSPSTIAIGQTITYTLVITNDGPSDVEDVQITDQIPPEIENVTWTCTPSSANSTCDQASGTGNAISTSGDIVAGDTLTYEITGTVANIGTGSIVNDAEVARPNDVTDPTPSNNADMTTVAVTGGNEADLSLLKTLATTVGATETTLTYTLVVTNNGPIDVTGVAVTDLIPTPIMGVSWTCSATNGSCIDGMGMGNVLNTTVNLSNGGTATYTITGTVPNSFIGTLTNNAAIAPPSGITDPDPTNNGDDETIDLPITPTDVEITKTAATPAAIGSDVSFTITVTNSGSTTALNVTVDDPTPTGLTFVSNSGDCTTAFLCDLGDIPAGQTRTITTTFNIPSDYSGPNPIANAATVTASNDANTGDNSAPESVPLANNPNLRLVKRITDVIRNGSRLTNVNFANFNDDPNDENDTVQGWTDLSYLPTGIYLLPDTVPLESGDIVEYTIYLLSDGSADLNNVQICDPIPEGTTFIPDAFTATSGIRLQRTSGGTIENLTNSDDGDGGTYFSPLNPVNAPCNQTNNPNGLVFIEGLVLPVNEAGFLRFQVQVD